MASTEEPDVAVASCSVFLSLPRTEKKWVRLAGPLALPISQHERGLEHAVSGEIDDVPCQALCPLQRAGHPSANMDEDENIFP